MKAIMIIKKYINYSITWENYTLLFSAIFKKAFFTFSYMHLLLNAPTLILYKAIPCNVAGLFIS